MSIEENIETVVSTFQKGRELAESGIAINELIVELNKFDIRYRSVAFEGASMGVALTNDLETWKAYSKASEKHATQVHIGLGWAIAQGQPPKSPEGGLDLASTLSQTETEYHVKVLDGYGYWNGLFSRRLTIRSQSIPENITPEFQAGFDQGVGRAIWYITKGEVDKVLNIINHFPENRRANLWQGIGVASTYVGGCSDELIAELKSAAGVFKMNFERGIEAAEGSMKEASLNTFTKL
ncbi:MAG: DUF1702 family protein [Flavobacteriales bacterium]|nr:DUF1702 family protein [Flavobacteriales bacterium]